MLFSVSSQGMKLPLGIEGAVPGSAGCPEQERDQLPGEEHPGQLGHGLGLPEGLHGVPEAAATGDTSGGTWAVSVLRAPRGSIP